jgi:2-dehydropantoate 2-reductase
VKVLIVGAGAVGGFIGGRLAAAGHAVAALARGATQEALSAHGWRIRSAAGELQAPVTLATQDTAALQNHGPFDLVIISLKAFALPGLALQLKPLVSPNTVILSAMNGVPWWFFEHFGGPARGMALPSVDPGSVIAAALPHAQVLGCVVHMTCSMVSPGYVKHGFGERLLIGAPSGQPANSPAQLRLQEVSAALVGAGFDAPVVPDIERQTWFKLWGNLTSNPISALTLATMDRLLADPLLTQYSLSMMQEVANIGAKIGCVIEQSGVERLALAQKLGPFKTSMLQDREAQRPMELGALVTAAHDIGIAVGVPTPFVDSLLGLIRVLDQSVQA